MNSKSVTIDDPLVRSYENYVRRIEMLVFLAGVLPSSSIRPVASYCAAFVTNLTCLVMSCFVLNFGYQNISNIAILTKGMSFVCSLLATSLKASCFIANRNTWIELHETLKALFAEELTKNPRTKPTLLSLLHTFDRPAYFYCFSVGGTLLSYLLPPIISILVQTANGVESKKYSLPFPAIFPWTVNDGVSYELHFLYEVLIAWYLCFTANVDNLFGFYIFHIASLLKAMTFQLENPLAEDDPVEVLKACVVKHRELLRCRDILQRVYGPIIIWLVLTNAVVMCALIFQGSQMTEMKISVMALFAFFMFLKLVQTFMYAWYGGILTTESEMFRRGFYFSNWLGPRSLRLKTDLLLIMMQRPMTITASGFFYVSVDLFTKILNTTMSYFFLLQTLDEK